MAEERPLIKVLEEEVERLRTAYADARRRLKEAQIAAAPYQVGDIVEIRDSFRSTSWRRAIIREVEPSWADNYDYSVSFAKKDGQWSAAVQHAYGEIRAIEADA